MTTPEQIAAELVTNRYWDTAIGISGGAWTFAIAAALRVHGNERAAEARKAAFDEAAEIADARKAECQTNVQRVAFDAARPTRATWEARAVEAGDIAAAIRERAAKSGEASK